MVEADMASRSRYIGKLGNGRGRQREINHRYNTGSNAGVVSASDDIKFVVNANATIKEYGCRKNTG
jgi:hypothetical protein